MTLNQKEFQDKVDLYGADLAKWPAAEVTTALAFMTAHPAAKAYFDDMARIEAALRSMDMPTTDTNVLETRILSRISDIMQDMPARENETADQNQGYPPAPAASALISIRPQFLFAPGGALLAIALIGFIMGSQLASGDDDLAMDPVTYAQQTILSITDDHTLVTGGI
jgi:hypothetical protein